MQSPSPSESAALRAVAPAAFTDFISQVRNEAGAWVRATVQRAAADLASPTLRHLTPGDRPHVAPALALLQGQRETVVAALVAGIRQQLVPRRDTEDVTAKPADSATLTLRLIDEAQIDADIEIARTVQAIESTCEAELRQLTALVCSLRGLRCVEPDATPLPPLACATGLRDGLQTLVPDAGLRLLLMRHLGTAVSLELRQVFAALAQQLAQRGVQPAQFKVRATPAPRKPGAASPPAAAAPRPAASAALWRLLERARQTMPADAAPQAAAPALQLRAEPAPLTGAQPALDTEAAVKLMERLLAQIEQHLGGAAGARAALADVREPALALAANEARLWDSPDHPWWQFLDRLIAVGTVHDDHGGSATGAVTRSLGLVVQRMRQANPIDRAACQTAADGVLRLATRRLNENHDTVQLHTHEIQAQADQQEVAVALREQLVQQLRSTAVCPALRQFLVGAWTQAMAHAAHQHGAGSPAVDALAFIVDDLIRATSRPGRPVSAPQRSVLLRQVGQSLAQAALPSARIEAELADLEQLLRQPPAVQAAPVEDDFMSLPTEAQAALQAGLPTVPIALMATDFDSTMEATGHRDWLDVLHPGTYCRLFLLGRWLTAQLVWASPSGTLFVFSSRHGGRTHSLTRRMLTKLRNAGLATDIEEGFLLAQAMDTLADSDLGAA